MIARENNVKYSEEWHPVESGADRRSRIEGWQNAPVIELQQGQEFNPWGTPHYVYIHGVNDGTHGSDLREAWTPFLTDVARRILLNLTNFTSFPSKK